MPDNPAALRDRITSLKEELKWAKEQRSVIYYREDKKTRELKKLYQEKEDLIRSIDKLKSDLKLKDDKRAQSERDYELQMTTLRGEVSWWKREAEDNKTLPGFTVEVLNAGEKEVLTREIDWLKTTNQELEKKLTMLSESDEIWTGMENLSMMLLQKEGADLLSEK